jgi:hypothetical protein
VGHGWPKTLPILVQSLLEGRVGQDDEQLQGGLDQGYSLASAEQGVGAAGEVNQGQAEEGAQDQALT